MKKTICQIFIKQSQDTDLKSTSCFEYNECIGFCKSTFTILNLIPNTQYTIKIIIVGQNEYSVEKSIQTSFKFYLIYKIYRSNI